MKAVLKKTKHIAFDADDTLWQNEIFFRATEKEYYQLMSDYGTPEELEKVLFEIEIGHLTDYGFGIKSFTLSMLETALRVSKNTVSAETIDKIIALGLKLLNHPVQLIGDPEKVILYLKEKGYRILLLTKGDLMDQNRKLNASGLRKHFEQVEVMTDKKESDYRSVFEKHQINPKEVMMIGNSLKSDILPLINIGAQAIYVPHDTTWAHEKIADDKVNSESYIEIKYLANIIEQNIL